MTTVKLRALAMVVMALTLSACTSSQTVVPTTTTTVATTQPLPAVDLSATPAGWVPVAYGDVQVSVPASFYVYYPGWLDCGLRGDALYLGPATPSAIGCGASSPNLRLTTLVYLVQRRLPLPFNKDVAVILNGIPVYPLLFSASMSPNPHTGRGGYYAPTLGAEVTAFGPMAGRVTDTLTRSPRSVVLASGSSPAVPSSWQQVTFAGLHFSVPAGWPISRTSGAAFGLGNPCEMPGVAVFASGVALSTDQHLLPPNACAVGAYSNAPQLPMDGVQVDSGSHLQFHVTLSFSAHCLDLHGLTACPATSPAYSILVLKVRVPVRDKAVFVSIGLAGNGMVARTILDSFRAA
jgi:hypothetical protein